LHGFVDGAVDKGISAFALLFSVGFDNLLFTFTYSEIDTVAVILLPLVFIFCVASHSKHLLDNIIAYNKIMRKIKLHKE